MSYKPLSGSSLEDLKAKIRADVAAEFAEDGVTADEVFLKDNGDVIIDRRRKMPWATPTKVAEWSTR